MTSKLLEEILIDFVMIRDKIMVGPFDARIKKVTEEYYHYLVDRRDGMRELEQNQGLLLRARYRREEKHD